MLRRHENNPAPLLEACFRRIQHERMADVPILNSALVVEASGFRPYAGHWLGVLITPWFLNLVIVPGEQGVWEHVAGEERCFRHFPAGSYAFLGNEEPEVGEFQTCSLISPMSGFPDQASARETAHAALELLLQKPVTSNATTPLSTAPAPQLSKRRMSKRDFLFRAFAARR